jgi:EAL domain-containing protein (putative c-di-GMP-specific phosphodiesterase class I)
MLMLEGNRSARSSGGRSGPLCFVVDTDFGFLREFSKALRELGVDTVELVNSARLGENVENLDPDFVFLNLNPRDPHDCTRALFSLKECRFSGRVQLMGRCESEFLESFRKAGGDASLTMLPALQKPIEFAKVRKVVLDQKLGSVSVAPPERSLRKAMANNWVSFCYQPKVDIRQKQVVGAEAFVRVTHPQQGVLAPTQFLAGANEEDLADLAIRALVDALKTGIALEQAGIRPRIAVNLSVETLVKLPLGELIPKYRPQSPEQSGLIFDVTETQVLNKLGMLKASRQELSKYGISLAIDNFGRGNSSFEMFKHLPFSEIKIDRSFAHGCSQIKENSAICRTMVQLAHNFSIEAVAVGVEDAADCDTLAELDCDIGQGYLFGKPTTAEELIKLVKEGQPQSDLAASAA